ncbi:uncharacterized protein LOC129344905 [Eublepharis macularius]|uniref:Uncharacterized protein LOC129344905 n=1 Tax=Eublepharis macularius TaxID=481883 RepID=A0AA97KKW3_EUBMA|nr:uncharacterized protein LOC129344905 [Eublepharis macularius]
MADKKLGEARTQFVERVNKAVIGLMLDDLLKEEVLNDEEVEKVKEKSAVTREQARMLIDDVRKKGPRASLVAIKSIVSRDGFLAGELGLTAFLEGSPSPQPLQAARSRTVLSVEETQPVESRQGIKLCPLNVFEKIQNEKADKIYPIIGDLKMRTRMALIICNIEFESNNFSRRDGAEKDMEGMECLLTGLGYKVEMKKNLCSEGMANCLKSFAAREEHKTSDSTFVVLMSHGLRSGLCGVKSQGENSDILSHDTIYSILNNKNCPALRDKPKVIIIQACRGENKGIIYVSDTKMLSADSLSPDLGPLEEYESDAIRRTHVESDLICFCSTTPDNVSWRSPQTGSVFIVQLRKQMQEHAWRCHLDEIFRKVQQEFQNNPLQMPTKERATLLKRFYLFPGHQEEARPGLSFAFILSRPRWASEEAGIMAGKKWGEVRKQLVERVTKAVVGHILEDLLKEGVLNDEDVEKVKEKDAKSREQAKMLMDIAKKKGPKAYFIAIESICSRDSLLAKELGLTAFLEGSSSQLLPPAPSPACIVEESEPVESRQGIKLCPQNVFEKIQNEKAGEIYPVIQDMKMRTRLALIICNLEFESNNFPRRDGAEKDMEGMECLLTGLGYEVELKTNLCSEGMADCLKAFAAQEEHKTSDSTFVVLMSHGLRSGLCGVKSQGENSDILSHDTIYSILNNKNCPALRDKPKVIIIQACRGENKGIIYVSDTKMLFADSLSPDLGPLEEYESDAIRRTHVESDLICFCSTTPDNVSWRSPQTGSVFIVHLIKQMQEHAWRCHLEEIFRKVQQEFQNNPLQMPTKERATLLKRFYLFPGH